MEMEDIENMTAEAWHVTSSLGFLSYDAYSTYKRNAAYGLERFGGSFAKALGIALIHADSNNSVKIISFWRSMCDQHAMLYQAYEAKRKAETA